MTTDEQAGSRAKTLWLHIGTEKTGTSTIQKLFHSNQALLASAGLLYPDTYIIPGTISHSALVNHSVGRGDRPLSTKKVKPSAEESSTLHAKLVDSLRREVADQCCETVLLSCEHLSTHIRTTKSIARLVDTLKLIAEEVRVIVYIRPQYQALSSLFSTQVKGGRTKPMELPKQIQKHAFNYEHLLSLWQSAPGLTSLSVKLFDRTEFVNRNLLDDFFAAIGFVQPSGMIKADLWANPRLDAVTSEFLRLVNGMTLEGASVMGPVRRSLVAELERLSDGGRACLTNATMLALDQMFAASNAAVAERYFPERGGQLFPRCPVDPGADIPLTLVKAVELGAKLWEAHSARLAEIARKRSQKKTTIEATLPAVETDTAADEENEAA